MHKIDELMQELTREEKAGLCSGDGPWTTKAVARLGIPAIMMNDGPHGLRKLAEADEVGLTNAIPATCFPPAVGLASTWNRGLLEAVGGAIGEEALAEDVSIVLGPGTNIKRHPLCGRNFEYFSEDPFLAGEMAASHIGGLQSRGVGASLKHFAANNQETRRMTVDVVAEERTLREIYLPAFETAVKRVQPWTVMAAYNRLNGTYCAEHPWLLNTVLREEWGFEGIVVTDWGACNDRVAGILAGLDLEMPGNGGINDEVILEAVRSGALAEHDLDRVVERILRLVERALAAGRRVGADAPGADAVAAAERGAATPATTASARDADGAQSARDTDPARDADGAQSARDADGAQTAHHALARSAAAESFVLLKNDDDVLPLAPTGRIAFLGRFAESPRYQGAGSSHIVPTRQDSLLQEARTVAPDVHIEYAPGYSLTGEAVDQALLREAVDTAANADVAVVCVGLPDAFESEGFDRDHMRLPESHVALIQEVAAVQPHTVVVLSNGSPVEMDWEEQVGAVLESYLGGQAWGGAVADVLFGVSNPSGKLAETIPLRLEDVPSYLDFPGDTREVRYSEGVFVGYRYYDSRKMAVRYPFGHGLSYTHFSYSDAALATDQTHVSCVVTNEGDRPGAEIVQLYVHHRSPSVVRPEQELKGFEKVVPAPGATATVEFPLTDRSFAYWDSTAAGWVVEAGEYELRIGASSRDIRLKVSMTRGASPDLPRTFDRNSMLGDTFDHRELGPVMEQLFHSFVAVFGDYEEGSPEERMFRSMVREIPLRDIVTFSQGRALSREGLEVLIDALNGERPAGEAREYLSQE